MTGIRIHSPEGSVGSAAVHRAASPDVLAGLRLVALDNGKPGAERLLGRVGERLAERVGLSFEGVRRKGSAATPCEDELLAEIVDRADLVLTGTAD